MSIPQILEQALQHHQAGRLPQAEQLYRQILAQQPNHADALHLLGLIAHQVGRNDAAVQLIEQAIALNPAGAKFYNNLGAALRDLGQWDAAIAAFRHAAQRQPDLYEAHQNLGAALAHQGHLEEATTALRDAVQLRPHSAQAHRNLGVLLARRGQTESAIAAFRSAIRLEPQDAEAHHNLGLALVQQGQFDEAVAAYRAAVALKPDFADAHTNLGAALGHQGQLDEAVAALQSALHLRPDHAEAHRHLGVVLAKKGEAQPAIAAFRSALRLRPDDAQTHNDLALVLQTQGRLDEALDLLHIAIRLEGDNPAGHANLGFVLKEQAQIQQAIAAYHVALKLQPDHAIAHSNLLFTLHYDPASTAQTLYEEHRRWNQRHARPLERFIRPHDNHRDPDRPLRIGYVSPDFRGHPVGRFLLPLLAHHDHRHFEIFAYAHIPLADAMTQQLRRHVDQWRDITNLSDQQVAEQVRTDRIDVLVDLALHSAGNRLLVFAHKPAPVQATYLAYCSTSGLDTMDYRLTDPYLDPPAESGRTIYSEQSIHLPETYWCYQSHDAAVELNALPALESASITFGCLNNFCKSSPAAWEAWYGILHAVPHSRLLLHAPEGSARQRISDRLQQAGIDPQRLRLAGRLSRQQYFRLYQQIDIALDPFPYGGGTTTCDALWMGVPVVSLKGQTAVGRGGFSILSNLGLPELVADDADQYVQIATSLANNLPRLSELRQTLRPRMETSPLMDAPRFARNIETAYRQMWRRWCALQR